MFGSGPRAHASTARWDGAAQTADGDTSLMLKISRGRASAELANDACSDSPRLQIPVAIELSTGDGELRENLDGQLAATREGFARQSLAWRTSHALSCVHNESITNARRPARLEGLHEPAGIAAGCV